MNKEKAREKEEAKEKLKEILDGVDTVYTIIRHVSQSGLYRVISLYIIQDNQPYCIDYLAGKILEGIDNRHGGCKASGAGMDAGFHLVYTLGLKVFGDGYKFKRVWL